MSKHSGAKKGHISLAKSWNKCGQLTARKTPEISCSYEYDTDGHRVGLSRSDGYKESLVYDAENKTCTITTTTGINRVFPYNPVRNMVYFKP